MIKKISLAVLVMALTTSCVSKKIYSDLENKYAELSKENRSTSDKFDALSKDKNQLDIDYANATGELSKLKAEHDKLQNDIAVVSNNLKTLQASYNALEKNSDEALQANMKKNRELLAQLDTKEKALAAEQNRLSKLQGDLKDRSQRIDELENMIASKEASMKKLKETLSKALNSFEGKGLTIEQKNGKVYVSMENKLLFQTGSWAVGAEGKKAIVEIGKVLAQNPDITVLIEGHTDNDKILGNIGGGIENN